MSANNPFSTASVKMRRTRIKMALLGESIGVASEGIKETVSN